MEKTETRKLLLTARLQGKPGTIEGYYCQNEKHCWGTIINNLYDDGPLTYTQSVYGSNLKEKLYAAIVNSVYRQANIASNSYHEWHPPKTLFEWHDDEGRLAHFIHVKDSIRATVKELMGATSTIQETVSGLADDFPEKEELNKKLINSCIALQSELKRLSDSVDYD